MSLFLVKISGMNYCPQGHIMPRSLSNSSNGVAFKFILFKVRKDKTDSTCDIRNIKEPQQEFSLIPEHQKL